MTKVRGIDEIILFVEDMEQMVSFYTDVVGFEIQEGDPSTGFVRFDTGACSLCLHAGGDGDIGRSAPKFVIGVSDVQSTREHLVEQGVSMSEIRSPIDGTYVSDGLDPEGNKFSIESKSESS